MQPGRAWQTFREWCDAADFFGVRKVPMLSAREINTNELMRENEVLRRKVDRLRAELVECQASRKRLIRMMARLVDHG